MSRAIDADFKTLKNFVEAYSIKSAVENPNQLAVVKSAHKSYLAFLQLWAITLGDAEKSRLSLYGHKIQIKDLAFTHFREAVSDVGSGFFCCLHGAYKPAHMALRSSIENFLRFAASPFDKSALTTTSVYDLFDIAKKTPPFAEARAKYLGQLRASYVELCKYSHSASLAHMAGIHALQHFPSFDENTFIDWQKHSKNCMISMICVAVLGQPSLYLAAHFRGKEILDELIPPAVRLTLLKNVGNQHNPAPAA